MIVSCIQTNPTKGQTGRNLDAVEEGVRTADADLIVLPELFASGYFFDSTEEAASLAEPIPNGPTTRRLHEWAAATGAPLKVP